MKAYDFYHSEECSIDICEAMEQYAEYRLKQLLEEIQSQANDAPITEDWIGFKAYKNQKK